MPNYETIKTVPKSYTVSSTAIGCEVMNTEANVNSIQRKDINIHSKLPGEGLMTYALATCASSKLYENTTFIVKSVSGKVNFTIHTAHLFLQYHVLYDIITLYTLRPSLTEILRISN